MPIKRLLSRVTKRHQSRYPELSYLETHLTDHCNLNCRGCGHLCPLSPDRFTDLEKFTNDVNRLSELFCNIKIFRLMGGEPLLHPNVVEFCKASRHAFPRAETDIRLVTNGILLPRMPKKFWTVCADNRVSIDLSQYPINIDIDEILKAAKDHDVKLRINNMLEFHITHRNPAGNSDPEKAFQACRLRYYCPFLENGKIFPCARPALVHILNASFNTDFPVKAGDYIDIHDRVTGSDIIDFISHSIPFCKYCTTRDPTQFKWGISKSSADEWLD